MAKEINIYDDEHDWCYEAANRWCGDKLDMAESIRNLAPSLKGEEMRSLIIAWQNEHAKLFEAFVHGALFGRAHAAKVSAP